MVGRKWGIVTSCVIFSLGVGLQLDTHWATFIVGRVIAGIGVVRTYRFSDHVYFSNFILF
jgi:Sugar (and other) transporter